MSGRARHLVPAAAGLVLGMLAIGPGLMPGFVLSYDMVFVPDPRFTAMTFGGTGTVPRHVPSDAFVTALATVLPADLVQKSILLSIFVMACVSAASLVPVDHLLPRLVAGVCYAWNPFVAERLLIGQWALLLGYAALPWVVAAAARTAREATEAREARTARSGGRGWPGLAPPCALVCALVPAAIGGFAAMAVSGLTALTVAVAAPAAGRGARVRAAGRTAVVLVLLSLPWLVTGWLRPSGVPADPAGVDAFAARADTPFGSLGSLLLLGGIWNGETVPPGYGAAVTATAWLLVVLAALGAYALWTRQGRSGEFARPWAGGLAVAAVAGLAAAWSGAAAPGVLRSLIRWWPGFSVLRDGQQYVAPLAVAVAVGLGLLAAGVVRGLPRRPGLLGAFLLALPPVLLPTLLWGAAGRLQAVEYPEGWSRAREIIGSDRVRGDVVVLPWSHYRSPEWNHHRKVLDPWPRLLTRRVVVNDAVRVDGIVIPAEDPKARRIDALLQSAGPPTGPPTGPPAGPPTGPLTGPLRQAGVRYVLVDADSGAGAGAGTGADVDAVTRGIGARLPGAERVLDRAEIKLYRLPDPRPPTEETAPRWVVWMAWSAFVLVVAIAAFVCARGVSGITLFTLSPRKHD